MVTFNDGIVVLIQGREAMREGGWKGLGKKLNKICGEEWERMGDGKQLNYCSKRAKL